LLIVSVTLGLGSGPAMAGDQAVMQPLPVSCQAVSDAELANLNGKQYAIPSLDLRQAARCIYTQLPAEAQHDIGCAVRVAKTIYTCINRAPAAPVSQPPAAGSVPGLPGAATGPGPLPHVPPPFFIY